MIQKIKSCWLHTGKVSSSLGLGGGGGGGARLRILGEFQSWHALVA